MSLLNKPKGEIAPEELQKREEEECNTGPLSVLTQSVKNNTQVLINCRNKKLLGRAKAFDRHSLGAPGWCSRLSVRLQPGHDLAVREFESRLRLWADGSEPGACFRFCVSLSLCPSPVHALSLSVPKINKKKNVEKKIKKKNVSSVTPLIL
uniref:Small nuclear ribonucleoprotein Sm D2 n=1 Tax=Lynx canadensis TaxID=61383 RepID=A0A667FZE8_LYNCA